ncbi:hypothetical protein L484_004373 [Morus notabilis]|uniref:Uncharacterized protein n=1 Tax=Morus notabilis TaxID=981085 RepID=W9RZV1_9ROSA|nr:hypothetical protein L484_004373 [Morus notabilis]
MKSCARRLSAGAVASDLQFRIRTPRPFAAEVLHFSRNCGERRDGIALRLSEERRLRAVGGGAAWERSPEGAEAEKEKVGACSYAIGERTASGGEFHRTAEIERREEGRRRAVEVVVAAAMTVVFGVGNRVLYKLALVPLKHYPFFLAQFATFGYVVVYFSILYLRYHAGIVTDEMLSMPKAPFLAVGLLEALAAATGMAAGGCDGAPLLPLLFVIVNMGFNISLLHLLKISSGVVSCLASTFSVPISVYLFTLPLPYLGVASSLPRGFVAGTIVLVMGLLIYAWTSSEGSSDTSPSESNLWS